MQLCTVQEVETVIMSAVAYEAIHFVSQRSFAKFTVYIIMNTLGTNRPILRFNK